MPSSDQPSSSIRHIRSSSKTHLLRYCSPTNLLTQLNGCRMCRSVYIYDFENSIPYFYLPFSYIFFFLWQQRDCFAISGNRKYFTHLQLIPDLAVCTRLFIYSFIHWCCMLCGILWLIRSIAVHAKQRREHSTRLCHSFSRMILCAKHSNFFSKFRHLRPQMVNIGICSDTIFMHNTRGIAVKK